MPLLKNPVTLLLPLLLMAWFSGLSQPCTPLFRNEYGGIGIDEGLAVTYTPDRGSIVGGRTTTNAAGSFDGFLMKLSETGAIQWARNYGTTKLDQIEKILTTPDGGYLALGFTRPVGSTTGEPFLLKTDAAGNPEWTRSCVFPGMPPMRGKNMIALRDGGYALLLNIADSTATADGLVTRIDNSGNPVWAFRFDHGRADGFHALVEEADSLVIGGYATIGARPIKNGLVMKLDTRTGAFHHQFIFERAVSGFNTLWQNTEVNMVDVAPGGLYFSALGTGNQITYSTSPLLHLFKRSNSGNLYFERESSVNTMFGLRMESVKTMRDSDSGFVFLSNDTAEYGGPEINVLGPSGQLEYVTPLRDQWERSHMPDMDRTGTEGYIAAGWIRPVVNYQLDSANIRVVKTDGIAKMGNCAYPLQTTEFNDTVIHHFGSFTWATRAPAAGFDMPAIALSSAPNGFAQTISCTDTYCQTPSAIADVCNASFMVQIGGETGRFQISETIAAHDGGFLAGGMFVRGHSLEMALMKLRPSGAVEWAKTYERITSIGDVRKILPTNDGNYIIAGYQSTVVNHGAGIQSVLMKVDPLGNLLWNRMIDLPYGPKIHDIMLLNDGGMIAAMTAGFGSGSTLTYVVRFDQNGMKVWARETDHGFGNPIYRKIVLDGDDLYVAADYYLSNGLFLVERWDIRNGTLLWNQRYNLSGKGTIVNGMLKNGDSLYLALGGMNTNSTPNVYQHHIVRLHKNGTIGGVYRLDEPNQGTNAVTGNYFWDMIPAYVLGGSDQHFVIGQVSYAPGGTSLVVTKFNPAGGGQLVWSRRYPSIKGHQVWSVRESSSGYVVSGNMPSPYQQGQVIRQPAAFVMAIDLDGHLDPNATGFCADTIAPFSTLALDLVKEDGNSADVSKDAREYFESPRHSVIRNLPLYAIQPCNLPATCTSVQVLGKDTLCSATAIYRYTMRTNAGCTSRGIWNLDSSAIQIVSRTDSSIDLRFPVPGSYRIAVQLSAGCRNMSNFIDVLAPLQMSAVNLGPDTSLCPGNTMTLRARSGYASYLWQDGSTDSVFQVSLPGSYHVRVTDLCGTASHDTILVQLKNTEPMNAGPEQAICLGDSLQISAPTGYTNYSWTGTTLSQTVSQQNLTVKPVANATYFIRAEKSPGCFAQDTIQVSVQTARPVSLGADTAFCAAQSLMLDAGAGYLRYTWNNGVETRQLEARTAGLYTVLAIDQNGCTARDSLQILQVFALPRVQLARDQPLCEGSYVNLVAPAGMRNYIWSDGSTESSMDASAMGSYWVRVTDQNGCVASDTTTITTLVPIAQNILPKDQSVCSYSPFTITPTRSFDQYLWSTNETRSSITINKPGTYWLRAIDGYGCIARDSIVITHTECTKGFFAPNVFTPNADGTNDIFKPTVLGLIVKYELHVFNRFGEKIFQSIDPNLGWNGNVKGLQQPTGTFTWYCIYQFQGEEVKKERGTVTLIR